jgi:type I restriction enzyme S subunit
MHTWKKYKLGELTTRITKGTTPTTLGSKFVKKGINFIKSEAIGYDGQIDKSTFVFIDDETHEKLKRSQLQKNDILFSMAGIFLGKNAIVTKDLLPANTNQALAIIRVDSEIVLSIYIHYYLRQKNIVHYVNNISGQSAQPNINMQEIGGIPIKLPPLPTQHRIAEILGALDDKIELNLQMNKTLEEMAMALYKHWFVDFGPFKDGEFVDSELGLIPKGWEVKRLKEIAKITMGQSPLSKFYNKEQNGLPFHQGVKDYGDRFPTDVIYSTDGNRIAEENDILFSVRAPVGKINIAKNIIILGRGLASLSLRQFGNNFLYYSLRNQFKEIDTFGDGTVYKSVSKNDMENIKLVFPSIDMLSKFNDFVSYIDKQIKLNYFENQSLQQTRDYLLPKLISGEVEVN